MKGLGISVSGSMVLKVDNQRSIGLTKNSGSTIAVVMVKPPLDPFGGVNLSVLSAATSFSQRASERHERRERHSDEVHIGAFPAHLWVPLPT